MLKPPFPAAVYLIGYVIVIEAPPLKRDRRETIYRDSAHCNFCRGVWDACYLRAFSLRRWLRYVHAAVSALWPRSITHAGHSSHAQGKISTRENPPTIDRYGRVGICRPIVFLFDCHQLCIGRPGGIAVVSVSYVCVHPVFNCFP